MDIDHDAALWYARRTLPRCVITSDAQITRQRRDTRHGSGGTDLQQLRLVSGRFKRIRHQRVDGEEIQCGGSGGCPRGKQRIQHLLSSGQTGFGNRIHGVGSIGRQQYCQSLGKGTWRRRLDGR